MEKINSNPVLKEILSWVEIIIIATVIAFVLNTIIIANSRVPSGSMEPTIMTNDRVIGSRLLYNFKDPVRGDAIIFRWPDDESTYFVKRIVGLPGDTVDIHDGHVYLNGSSEALDEPYIKEDMNPNHDPDPLHFTVPADAYFCMGDNRNNSVDARYWKNTYVYRNKIIAKVIFQYYPKIKMIK